MTSEPIQPVMEFEHDDFDFDTIEEELRVNERCQSLLHQFYLHLQGRGVDPQHASDLAYSADYYLRDYVLDFARQNVVCPQPGIVSRFAGSWYIKNTLDPEIKALELHLEAIRELYRFLHAQHFICLEELAFLEEEAGQIAFYRQRIECFLEISGDGFAEWDAQFPTVG